MALLKLKDLPSNVASKIKKQIDENPDGGPISINLEEQRPKNKELRIRMARPVIQERNENLPKLVADMDTTELPDDDSSTPGKPTKFYSVNLFWGLLNVYISNTGCSVRLLWGMVDVGWQAP